MKSSLPAGFMEINFERYYQTTPSPRGRMRCLAMLHLQKGKTICEVSEIVQQSRVSISKWLRWLRQGRGIDQLIDSVKGRGRKAKVSFIDDDTLRSSIKKMQDELCGGRITGKDIQRLIKQNWDVDYALSSIYVLLERLNLSWITSRSQHPRMDAAAQEDFKKTLQSRLKPFYPRV